jgi:DNA repair photolyase
LNDKDLEAILEAAVDAGATSAGWVMLRLPLEVAPLFRDWLQTHYPLRAAHVMGVVNDVRGGRDNDPCFGSRMRGRGAFADLIEQRFRIAAARCKLNGENAPFDTSRFKPPVAPPKGRAALPANERQLDLL